MIKRKFLKSLNAVDVIVVAMDVIVVADPVVLDAVVTNFVVLDAVVADFDVLDAVAVLLLLEPIGNMQSTVIQQEKILFLTWEFSTTKHWSYIIFQQVK